MISLEDLKRLERRLVEAHPNDNEVKLLLLVVRKEIRLHQPLPPSHVCVIVGLMAAGVGLGFLLFRCLLPYLPQP